MYKLVLPLFVMAIVFVILAPLAYIWAINTLFPMLHIDYSFENWLAMGLVHSFFHHNISISKK